MDTYTSFTRKGCRVKIIPKPDTTALHIIQKSFTSFVNDYEVETISYSLAVYSLAQNLARDGLLKHHSFKISICPKHKHSKQSFNHQFNKKQDVFLIFLGQLDFSVPET